MAVYYYLSPEPPPATQEAVLAFTHDDRYKPLAGYQVAVGHFHTHFNEAVADAGSLDFQPPWIPTFRALGINVAVVRHHYCEPVVFPEDLRGGLDQERHITGLPERKEPTDSAGAFPLSGGIARHPVGASST